MTKVNSTECKRMWAIDCKEYLKSVIVRAELIEMYSNKDSADEHGSRELIYYAQQMQAVAQSIINRNKETK